MTADQTTDALIREQVRQMLLAGRHDIDGDVTLTWAVVKPWLNHEDYCWRPGNCDGSCQENADV